MSPSELRAEAAKLRADVQQIRDQLAQFPVAAMSPEELRLRADTLASTARTLEYAARMDLVAGELEQAALARVESSGHDAEDMTKAQLQRRGDAVARAKAKKSGHPVALAIAASRWKSITAYAEKRLRVEQSTLSKYISGRLECPGTVADRIREDFGLGDDVWPTTPRRN